MQNHKLTEGAFQFPKDLSDLIHSVCQRPAMFTGKFDWSLAAAFIDGCWYGLSWMNPNTYDVEEWRTFSIWLGEKYNYPRNYTWKSVRNVFATDEDAFAALPGLFDEFRSRTVK